MFAGTPPKTTLRQATERKAAAGDPLAQKILTKKWTDDTRFKRADDDDEAM